MARRWAAASEMPIRGPSSGLDPVPGAVPGLWGFPPVFVAVLNSGIRKYAGVARGGRGSRRPGTRAGTGPGICGTGIGVVLYRGATEADKEEEGAPGVRPLLARTVGSSGPGLRGPFLAVSPPFSGPAPFSVALPGPALVPRRSLGFVLPAPGPDPGAGLEPLGCPPVVDPALDPLGVPLPVPALFSLSLSSRLRRSLSLALLALALLALAWASWFRSESVCVCVSCWSGIWFWLRGVVSWVYWYWYW